MPRSIVSHAINTWLVAHGFNFLLLLFLFNLSEDSEAFQILILIVIIIMAASLPVIAIFWVALNLILNTSFSARIKLFIWVLVAPLLTAINALLLALMLSDKYFRVDEFLPFGIPAVAATLLAVLVRYHQFFTLNIYIGEKKSNENQTI